MDPILAHIHLSFHSSQNLPVPFGALVAGFIGTGDLAITKYTVVFLEKGDFSVMGGLCSHQRRSALVRKQLRKIGFTFCFQLPKERNFLQENKKKLYDTMQNQDIDRELMKLPFTRRRELFEALSVGIAGANSSSYLLARSSAWSARSRVKKVFSSFVCGVFSLARKTYLIL
jgi:hypothetical protein